MLNTKCNSSECIPEAEEQCLVGQGDMSILVKKSGEIKQKIKESEIRASGEINLHIS